MKIHVKYSGPVIRTLFMLLFVLASFLGFSQRRSAISDLKLGKIELTDMSGNPLDINALYLDQVMKLKLPVSTINHGGSLPVGSCKIKIGFGSKMVLDPQFNLNDAGLNNYFRWSSSTTSGQLQITGELISALPADFREMFLFLKVKGNAPGKSAITANFLITNHNTTTIVSDEDGANNAAFLQYVVTDKVPPLGNASELELSLYPNPVIDGQELSIYATRGVFNGKYVFNLMDASGKVTQTREMVLNNTTTVKYSYGNIAAGKYFIRVANSDRSKSFVLKFERL